MATSDSGVSSAPLDSDFEHPPVGQSHLLRFRGSAHPPGQDDDYDGMFLRRNEMEAVARRAAGTPVWHKHQGDQKAGWIREGWVDDTGRLMVEGVLDRRTKWGRKAVRMIRDGDLSGLSLGLSHLKADRGGGDTRIIARRLGEVSLEDDPDLPDTAITAIAPDPPKFELAGRYMHERLYNNKTKGELLKSRNELRQAILDVAAQKPASQRNNGLFGISSVSANRRVEEAKRKATMSVPGDAQQAAAASQQQQQQQQPAPAAGSAAAAAPPSSVAADLSELASVQKQLAELQRANDTLAREKSENEGMLAAIREDPDHIKRAVASYNTQMQTLIQHIQDKKQEVLDGVIADYAARGKEPDQRILDAIQNADKMPEQAAPLFQYVESVAGAANANRVTEVEKNYQVQKEENDRLRTRLNESDDAKAKYENELKQLQTTEEKKRQYSTIFTQGGSADGSDRAAKSARTDAASSATDSAASTSDGAAAASFAGGMTFGSATPSTPQIFKPLFGMNPLRNSDDQTTRGLLAIFESRPTGQGMGAIDMKGIVGREYAPMRPGYTNPDGTLMAGAVEAERIPRAIPQDDKAQ